MNSTKKIITLAVILGLGVLSFILFGNKMTATTPSNSAVSSAMSKMSEVMIKDNKTIELAPKDITAFIESTNLPKADVPFDPEFSGVVGTKYYTNTPPPLGLNFNIQIVNASQTSSEKSKAELLKFKTLISTGTIPEDQALMVKPLFQSIDTAGGYSKTTAKVIPYTKPSNFDNLKAIVSYDGQSQIMNPTLNLVGSRGGDYFLFETILGDLNIDATYTAAIEKCPKESADTNTCIKNEARTKFNSLLTNEYLKAKLDLMVGLLN